MAEIFTAGVGLKIVVHSSPPVLSVRNKGGEQRFFFSQKEAAEEDAANQAEVNQAGSVGSLEGETE